MNLLADYNWLTWILIGAFAGAVARLIMPGRGPSGCIVTIALGIGGALLAGYLGHTLGLYPPSRGADWVAAIVGALIILFVYRLVAGRR